MAGGMSSFRTLLTGVWELLLLFAGTTTSVPCAITSSKAVGNVPASIAMVLSPSDAAATVLADWLTTALLDTTSTMMTLDGEGVVVVGDRRLVLVVVPARKELDQLDTRCRISVLNLLFLYCKISG